MESLDKLIEEGKPIKIDAKEEIKVGHEGVKFIADLYAEGKYLGEFFLKHMSYEKKAFRQLEIYQHFKNGGAKVPKSFNILETSDNELWAAMPNLTENGKFWVYSMDASEINKEDYKKTVKLLPTNIRTRIRAELIKTCEVASIPVLEESHDTDIYELRSKSFMIAISPKRLEDSTIYVADYGDIDKRKDMKQALDESLRAAAVFYTWMLGEEFEFPEKYKYLEKTMVLGNDLKRIIEFRNF